MAIKNLGSNSRTHEHYEIVPDSDTAQDILLGDAEALSPAPPEVGKTMRKVDSIILPLLGICYAFFYIDKVCAHTSWVSCMENRNKTQCIDTMVLILNSMQDNLELCSHFWD